MNKWILLILLVVIWFGAGLAVFANISAPIETVVAEYCGSVSWPSELDVKEQKVHSMQTKKRRFFSLSILHILSVVH